MRNGLFSIQKGEVQLDASILYEMPCQKGNEGCQEHNYEEWKAGNSGCVPCMWNQDVPDREELKLIFWDKDYWRGWVSVNRYPAFLLFITHNGLMFHHFSGEGRLLL